MRVRPTARVLLFDPMGRVLLMKGRMSWAKDGPGAWFTVGGGADEGESLAACAARELREETGFTDVELGPVVLEREVVLGAEAGDPVLFQESYFVARCAGGEIVRDSWQEDERELIDDIRWWSLEELADTRETMFPEGFADLAARAARAYARPPILSSERLIFHPFTEDDLPLLTKLHSDPEVQRTLGGMWDAATIAQRLARFVTEQAERGHSKWKVFTRDGEFIGRAGVSLFERTGELELGYTLARPFWGKGYASEAAAAVRDWAFRTLPVDHIIGFTDLQNLASQRVLERIGMRRMPDADLGHGSLSALYRLERPSVTHQLHAGATSARR